MASKLTLRRSAATRVCLNQFLPFASCPFLYVANRGRQSVDVFASGANRDVTPIATIRESNRGINEPWGVALAPSVNMYVSSTMNDSVVVYAAGTNGNVAPIQRIAGTKTKQGDPYGLAGDGSDNIHIANYQSAA